MEKSFLELGKRIERIWEKGSCNPVDFSNICLEELGQFSFDRSQDELEEGLTQSILESGLPRQLNVYNTFGQPPLTIFNNEKFVLDLYFWMGVDTSIHSHSFSGAFKLLFGRSIHEIYSITPKKIFGQDVMSAEIKQASIDLIKTGDIQSIVPGNQFSHRLIHLDTPTITLCARTINDVNQSQWHHFSNGLSIEKRSLPEQVIKVMYFYEYLFNQNQEKASTFLSEMIGKWDISVALNLYEQLSIDGMGLGDGAIEHFFNLLIDRYGSSEWFKLYQEFYQDIEENYIYLEGSSPEDRFTEHAINSRYPLDKAKMLLEEIQGQGLSELQQNQFSSLQ